MAGLAQTMDAMRQMEGKPDEKKEWGRRLMESIPHNPYFGEPFRDDIFKAPPAAGTETLGFDLNTITPDLMVRMKQRPAEEKATILGGKRIK